LGKTGVFKRETFPSATFSTPTQNDWSGIKLHGESAATNCLNHGSAVLYSVCAVLSQHAQEQSYLHFAFMDQLTHHCFFL